MILCCAKPESIKLKTLWWRTIRVHSQFRICTYISTVPHCGCKINYFIPFYVRSHKNKALVNYTGDRGDRTQIEAQLMNFTMHIFMKLCYCYVYATYYSVMMKYKEYWTVFIRALIIYKSDNWEPAFCCNVRNQNFIWNFIDMKTGSREEAWWVWLFLTAALCFSLHFIWFCGWTQAPCVLNKPSFILLLSKTSGF
jgi:hypothetical protein